MYKRQAYTGLIKRETSKALHAVINFVVVFVLSASFIAYAPDYIKKINEFSSDISTASLDLGTKIMLPNSDSEGKDLSLIHIYTGILDIPELAEKCRKREYIGKSRSYKFYQSGELIKHREDDREYMGRTLYLGSLKSDVYFCIYEKDYEQYVKLGTPLEEADIINRFEIRLRNERAYYAVRDLLTYYDAEQTAFSIINQYVRFVDEEPDKRKNDWKLNDRWAWFIGDNRQSLKLTTKPEPYTLDRTLPVSYTHLDVYKRQVLLMFLLGSQARRRAKIM